MLTAKMPDITKADAYAYTQAIVVALIVLFKLDLTDAQQAALVAGLAAVIGLAHMFADAYRRGHRATALANLEAADITASSLNAIPRASDMREGTKQLEPVEGVTVEQGSRWRGE